MRQEQRVQLCLVATFLLLLLSVPVSQTIVEWRRQQPLQAAELFQGAPTEAHLRRFESRLEQQSFLARQVRPLVQLGQWVVLGDPGDKALLGCDGWLFYKPGVRYLSERPPASAKLVGGPGDTARGSKEAVSAVADVVRAVREYRDQLARRGIELLVVPVPNKESIYPENLRCGAEAKPWVCEQTEQVLTGLQEAGVEVVDLFAVFGRMKEQTGEMGSLYLAQDSHWSPLGMQKAAAAVAQRLKELNWVQAGSVGYETQRVTVRRHGDILRMMQAPLVQKRFASQEMTCWQVIDPTSHEAYHDESDSRVLVLGDSFLRIYEHDEPGAAGFAAHLAQQLGQPVASVVSDGGASTLVRQQLARKGELLLNKKVVVWEFVERDIRFGTEGWQDVSLPPATGDDVANTLTTSVCSRRVRSKT